MSQHKTFAPAGKLIPIFAGMFCEIWLVSFIAYKRVGLQYDSSKHNFLQYTTEEKLGQFGERYRPNCMRHILVYCKSSNKVNPVFEIVSE